MSPTKANIAPIEELAKPKSAYKGVSSQFGSKWQSRRKFKGKQYHLGSYGLEADSAFACNCAVKGLWNNKGTMNFETKRDYFSARKLELESKGVSADKTESLNEVIAGINRCCEIHPAE
jgi:hypothetical protein